MSIIPEDTPLDPAEVRPITASRPKTAIENIGEESLFQGRIFDETIKNYDLKDLNPEHTDTIYVNNTPGLRAIRNSRQQQRSKSKAVTVRPVTGHKYFEKPIEYVSMLTPNQKRKPLPSLAVTTQKLQEESTNEERLSLGFREDPISYFSKHKDGGGHHFIYLIFTKPISDENFNPYELKKVPHAEITPEYFTMSASGVTHVNEAGNTDIVPLDVWSLERAAFSSIRKLRFFHFYKYWKNFQIWKKYIQFCRFTAVRSKIITKTLFSKSSFFTTLLEVVNISCSDILNNYLLSFIPQKKFTITEFKNTLATNKEKLNKEYREYLQEVMGAILDLLADIIDPERVNIKIHDVDKSQKMFPDLGYLTEVARKIKIVKAERTLEVQQETFDFCDFIRICDYFILENLHQLCLKCWKQAENSVLQSLSSIFQVEVSYDSNGKVIFTPSLNELLSIVTQALDQSISILDGLPRIIGSSKFRPHLIKKYGNIENYFDKAPTFKQFTDCNKEFASIKRNIIESVKESYISSYEHSKGFENFYDIFVRGREWSPETYIQVRGGESINFDLMKFASDYDRKAAAINYNPAEEEIVIFRTIRDDIEKFRQEDIRISEFTTCTVQGSIYINSKNLRQCLTPIPARSMQQIKECLKVLYQNKIEHIGAIFRFCSKRLKKEPESLIQYVENCEFNDLMENLSKYLHMETSFVDELCHLLDALEYHTSRGTQRSPLGSLLKQFVYDQTNANSVADQMRNAYTLQLSNKLKTAQAKIMDFDERLKKSPPDIKGVLLPEDANKATELLNEINSLETEVVMLNKSQTIMKVNLADLSDFYKVREEIKQLLVAYDAVLKWREIDAIITTIPFNAINIMDFNKKVTDLNDIIMNLKNSLPLHLVDDLSEKIDTIVPYLEVLETLANSKMNYNHWNILFEMCGHPKGYFQQIKIDELMQQGILAETAKIEDITATALGENQLEQEFKLLLQHWKEVKMPLDETQTKTDDTLMIGDIREILKEIEGGKNTVQQMLSGQYVQGLKPQVLSLGATLDTFSNVLIAWKAFQENWIVLNVFFSKKDNAAPLQSLSSQFIGVRRRWMSLVRHASENLTLFHICEFPSILEMLRENNEFLITIMKGVLKFIDIKRYIFPRLFFLGNNEVMRLFTTTDFEQFNSIFSKMFMHVQRFETHSLDAPDTDVMKNAEQSFPRIKIYGMQGTSGDQLLLMKPINCAGGVETWGDQVLEQMTASVSNSLQDALYKYKNVKDGLWFANVSIYSMVIITLCQFTREIEECFDNFENNVRTFTDYRTKLKDHIRKYTQYLYDKKNIALFNKISTAITFINYQLYIIDKIIEYPSGFERRNFWENRLRLRYRSTTNQVEVWFGSKNFAYGYEYWGECPPLLICESKLTAIENICSAIASNNAGILLGPAGSGKKHLISTVAALFGKHIAFCPAYNDPSSVSVLRNIVGAIQCKSWIVFADMNRYSQSTLAMMIDIYRDYKSKSDLPITYDIGNYKVRLCDQFVLFATGPTEMRVPDTIRHEFAPIVINNIDAKQISMIMLASIGFRNSELLADRLVTASRRLLSIFDNFPTKGMVSNCLSIINISKEYAEVAKASENEDFVLSWAAFHHFRPFVDDNSVLMLEHIVYDCFYPTNEFNMFHIYLPNRLGSPIERRVDAIIEHVPKNDKYLYEKTYDFLKLLYSSKCTFVYGSSNSGKTTVINQAVDAINGTEGELPLKLFEIYHASSTIQETFGYYEYAKDGHVYHDGLIAPILKEIRETPNSQFIIKFNGPITNEFSIYLAGLLCSKPQDVLMFNNYESFPSYLVRIVIETDSVEAINPQIVQFSKFLPLHDVQTVRHNPIPIFERTKKYNNCPPEGLRHMRDEFYALLNPIIQKILLLASDLDTSYLSWIVDILPEYALTLAFKYIDRPSFNSDNADEVKCVLLHSIFLIYAPLLTYEVSSALNSWLVDKYQLQVPLDWAQYDVPKAYWDAFPKPSLRSMILKNTKFIPHSFANVGKVFEKREIDKDHMNLPDNIVVVLPEYIPYIFEFDLLLHIQIPIMIAGPSLSGKSMFIESYFRLHPEIMPLIIPVNSSSTGKSITQYIEKTLEMFRVAGVPVIEIPRLALIFDNLNASNVCVMEYIRSLSTTKNRFLQNAIIIVTAKSYRDFPARFISRFVVMSFSLLSIYTIDFVVNTVAQHLGVEPEFPQTVMNLIRNFPHRFHFMRILDCISVSIQKTRALSSDALEPAQILLGDFRFLLTHAMDFEELKTFNTCFRSIVTAPQVLGLYMTIMDGTKNVFPEHAKDSLTTITYNGNPIELYREELEYVLGMQTTPADIAADTILFRPVIKDYVLLYRGTFLPGSSVILKGKDGIGRRTLSRFLAAAREMLYMEFDPNDPEKSKERFASIIWNSVLKTKEAVIFVPYAQLDNETRGHVNNIVFHYNSYELLGYEKYMNFLARYMEFTSSHISNIECSKKVAWEIHDKLHFVFSVPEDYNCDSLNVFPTVYMGRNQIEFSLLSGEDLLRSQGLKEYIQGDISQLGTLFSRIYKLVSKVTPMTRFFDFMKNFKYIYRLVSFESNHLHHLANESINFVMTIENQVAQLEKEIKELEGCAENKDGEFEDKETKLKEKKQSVRKRLNGIKEEEEKKKKEIEELDKKLNEAKNLAMESQRNASLALNKISSAPQNLNSFFTNRFFVRLFELLCFFCGDQPKFEPYGRQLATDANIKLTLQKRVSIIKLSNNAENAEKLITQNYDELTALSPFVEQLTDYAVEMCKACHATTDLQKSEEDTTAKKQSLNQVLENYQIEKDSIFEILHEIKLEEEDLSNNKSSYNEKNSDYNTLKEKRQGMDELVDKLSRLNDRWMILSSRESNSSMQNFGNAILAAFFMTYGGENFNLIDEVIKLLKDTQATLSSMHPHEIIGLIMGTLDIERDLKISDLNIALRYTLFTRLAFHASRTPLISDFDGYIFGCVMRTIPKPERIVVSMETSSIMDKFHEAAEKGHTLIIIDVKKLTTNLQYFLRMARSVDGKSTIDVGQRKVKIHENFRVMLFTPLPMSEIPSNLKCLVIPIDFVKFSNGFPRDVIERIFTVRYNPKELLTVADPSSVKVSKMLEINTTEKELLEVINDIRENQKNDIHYVLVEDNDTFHSLLSLKKNFLSLISEEIDFEELSDGRKVVLHPYEAPVDIAESIWLALSRFLPRISNLYKFNLSEYTDMINEIIAENNDYDKLSSLIVSAVQKKYFHAMTMRDAIFFMLIASFFNNCRHGFTHENDLQTIIQHLQAEYDGKIQMFGTDSGRCSFDQMKFVNILGFYSLATRLIAENFDPHFMDAIPLDQIPLDKPIVIVKHTNRTLKVYLDTDEDYEEFTFGVESDALATMKNAVVRARIHGSRIIVYYDSPSPSIAEFINDNIDAINTTPPHERFQLIISCSTSQYIPASAMWRLWLIQTREPICVVQTMKQIKDAVCDKQDSFQLYYAISTILSIQAVRAALKPCGLVDSQFINEELIRRLLERLKRDKLTVLAARKIAESVISNSFAYPDDAQKVISHIKKFINPDITDDIFTFTRSQISSISPWIIPKESKLYDETVSHLPIIPSVDVLGVDRTLWAVLESYSMSRWLAEPFTLLSRGPNADSTAKISSILVTIPSYVEIPLHLPASPAAVMARKEAKIYNDTIKAIKVSVQAPTPELHNYIANDICPPEWMKAARINTTVRIAAFFRALMARREFIEVCIKTQSLPRRIETNSCSDPRALVSAVCASIATNFSEPTCVFELERDPESPLSIDGISVVGWGFDPRSKNLITPTKITKPSTRLFTLHLRARPSSPELKIIPLLLTLGPNIPENFVCNVAIRGDISDEDITINGVCAVIHLPASLED